MLLVGVVVVGVDVVIGGANVCARHVVPWIVIVV